MWNFILKMCDIFIFILVVITCLVVVVLPCIKLRDDKKEKAQREDEKKREEEERTLRLEYYRTGIEKNRLEIRKKQNKY